MLIVIYDLYGVYDIYDAYKVREKNKQSMAYCHYLKHGLISQARLEKSIYIIIPPGLDSTYSKSLLFTNQTYSFQIDPTKLLIKCNYFSDLVWGHVEWRFSLRASKGAF